VKAKCNFLEEKISPPLLFKTPKRFIYLALIEIEKVSTFSGQVCLFPRNLWKYLGNRQVGPKIFFMLVQKVAKGGTTYFFNLNRCQNGKK